MRIINCIVIIIAALSIQSCVSNKELTKKQRYFTNIKDSLFNQITVYDPIFEKGDILYIGIFSENEVSVKKYNQPNFYVGAGQAVAGAGSALGYLIDTKGEIEFPELGRMRIEGLTKTQLSNQLVEKLKPFLTDVSVTIRHLNYKITILGEVAKPGTFSLPGERVTVLDAIGLAGDLTIYGKRDNIKIIRESAGKREVGEININDGNIFTSPFYFLRQNDIVYVELNERKIPNTDNTFIRNLGIATSLISATVLIVSLINQIN